MIYRSATFDANSKDEVTKLFDGKQYLPIRKMCHKYSRNPDVPVDKDVFKVTFFLDSKRVRNLKIKTIKKNKNIIK